MPSSHDLSPHKNSFTFIRLSLAMMVLFSHASVIGGFGGDIIDRWSIGQTSANQLAVRGFFVISGYLLSHSLSANSSLLRFSVRRIFRIIPGFWAVLLLSSFVVAPLVSAICTHPWIGYRECIIQGNDNALGYLSHNWLLYVGQMEIAPYYLPEHRPLVLNGSLWSLFYEALCYIGLGLAGWAGILRRRAVIFSIFWILYLPLIVYFVHPFPTWSNTTPLKLVLNFAFSPFGPCVMLAFASGVAAHAVIGGKLPWEPRHFVLACLVFAVALTYGGANLVWPFALPYILLSLARRLPFWRLDRFGDVSYGVYLYASLILHCFVLFGIQHLGYWIYAGSTMVLSLLCGTASWFLLEKHLIRIGRWIVNRLPAASVAGRPQVITPELDQ
jgi:peptidoglycan/LPS O-acetylase OafA/YrhL